MKKNYVLLLFLFILGTGLFVSCYDDEPEVLPDSENAEIDGMLKNVTNPEIKKAIVWYEEHGQNALLARGGGEHPLFSKMIPAWSYAFVRSSSDRYRTVEVPLWTYSRTLFTLPENAIAYDATKNSMYIQSLTRLVVLTDKINGTTQGFFMTLVPTKKYMDARNFNVYRSTYLNRERDFDGYVYFHELDGSFANGWRYAEGEITHKVRKAGSSSLARSGHYEYIRHCYPKYRRVCTGYWQTTESGGQEYVEVNCYEEYAGEECYTETVWVPDPNPGTGGGSGGGYPGESHADGEMVVESRWWPTGHNDIIDDVFEGLLTEQEIEMIKDGSNWADIGKGNQDEDKAFMHAMRSPNESMEEVVAKMRNHFDNYVNQFREGHNYMALGVALHMIMDTYSPMHSLKVWKIMYYIYYLMPLKEPIYILGMLITQRMLQRWYI